MGPSNPPLADANQGTNANPRRIDVQIRRRFPCRESRDRDEAIRVRGGGEVVALFARSPASVGRRRDEGPDVVQRDDRRHLPARTTVGWARR